MSVAAEHAAARCQEVIDTLVIPRPFDVDRFLASLAEKRGRKITLIPGRLGTDQPCGMLISTTDTDYIYCASNVPPLQARHTVMHEVGHLLLDHCTSAPDCDDVPQASGDDALRQLLPTLSPALVRRILGRTVYATGQEREAELFASLVLARVSSARDAYLGLESRDDDLLAGLESAFGDPVRGRRPA